MPKENYVILGAQWGDEGKGKIVDCLAKDYSTVVRFQGGPNAGHSIAFDDHKIVLHHLPCGVLHPGTMSIMAHGMVIDPVSLLEEMEQASAINPINEKNLMISSSAYVITSYHRLLDRCREDRAGDGKIGTTCRGIGPCYEDKVARRGVRIWDLLCANDLRKALEKSIEEKLPLFRDHFKVAEQDIPDLEEEMATLLAMGDKLRPMIGDTLVKLRELDTLAGGILFEGAQGVLLDLEYGTYPFVTSSSTVAQAICQSTGMSPKRLGTVVGISKAYTTRVGTGPFPTEQDNDWGNALGKLGGEFGATTGRKRRCGHLDLPMLKHAVLNSHMDAIGLTKIDVLMQMPEGIKVCHAYEYEGKAYDCFHHWMDEDKIKPIYKDFDLSSSEIPKAFNECDSKIKEYISFIEEKIGVPICMLGVGPRREELLFK